MTLIKSLRRHFVFAIATFFLLSGSTYAKKHRLSGQVFDPEQEKVKGAEIAFILDGNIEKEVTTDRKGNFKAKLEEGVYTVRASYDGLIAEKQGVDLSDNVELELVLAEPKIPEPEKEKTEDWCRQVLTAVTSYMGTEGGTYHSSRTKDIRNYQIYNGVLSQGDYTYITEQYGLTYPARLVNYPIITPKID